MKTARPNVLIPVLALALLAIAACSIFIGPAEHADANILWNIRLPRVVLGVLVGTSLAAAGAIMQGLLRNPLADPYILGTSSGAAIGALVAFQLRDLFPEWVFLSHFSFYALIFAGSFFATLSSYLIARSEKHVSIVNLLLSGVIVNTFCGALIFLFFTLRHRDSFSMFFFLMGSLVEGQWNLISVSGIIIVLGILASLFFAKSLNIISLGEDKAHHLGIEVEKLKVLMFALVSLIVSAAVAISGTIGFVGLIVPHITRLLVGPNHRVLIPASALAGGIVLLCADNLARTIAKPIEVPVGIIMCMIGAPFFLWLLRRKRKEKYF